MDHTASQPTLLVLNGVSSSGKSTLLRALQQALPEPYLDAGLDRFLWMLPKKYLDQPLWSEIFHYEYSPPPENRILSIQPGVRGRTLVSGMHSAIASLLNRGNNVLADHVLLDPAWLAECAQLFQRSHAFLIAIECPLEVLEAHERSRRDRTLGQARAQYETIHASKVYDFAVTTHPASPEENTHQILTWLASAPQPAAFRQIASMLE